jgi:nickel-dependent lactate racemase
MNLYQAVKGMSAAARIVKQGGVIIAAAECSDGVPMHGHFRELLLRGKSPQEWLEMIYDASETIPDQWQVQILAKILQKATVYLRSTLPEHEVLSAHLTPVRDIAVCVGHWRDQFSKAGQNFRMAVLPEGPQTIPYLLNQTLTIARS